MRSATPSRRPAPCSESSAAEAARPGDTVLVRPGVYREEVRIPRGGTAQAPIVFRSAVRDNDGHGVWFDTGFTNRVLRPFVRREPPRLLK